MKKTSETGRGGTPRSYLERTPKEEIKYSCQWRGKLGKGKALCAKLQAIRIRYTQKGKIRKWRRGIYQKEKISHVGGEARRDSSSKARAKKKEGLKEKGGL